MEFFASPAVRAKARRAGVDLAAVASASGRDTLTRDDVAAQPPPANADDPRRFWNLDHERWGSVTLEPTSRLMQAAAANLAAAQALIPQVTNHGRADMRRLEAFRTSLLPEAAARGAKLTTLAFHVKALAHCLQEFPRFNASLSPDGAALVLKQYIHIGVAVDTPHGLVVPVVRDVDRKGVWRIASEITELAGRAQTRKLRPDDSGGASMSITNIGAIRGGAFTPLINPPEAAILGVSRSELVPVWEDGGWAPVPTAPLSLSWDHRVVNGAEAARFLTRLEGLLSDPRRLLI